MMRAAGVSGSLVLACVGALAGCDLASVPGGAAPALSPSPRPAVIVRTPSVASAAVAQHFERVQASLMAQGLLRSDGGGADVPFTARMLADNFIRIALYDEYVDTGGLLVARENPSTLRRWEQPIRMQLIEGASVAPDRAAKDRADIAAYAARLARLSGLSIRQTDANPNFQVLILNEDERRSYGDRLRALVPGIDDTAVAAITGMPQSTFCLVFAFSGATASTYSRALAVIRAEHPDALRLSCIHEELAQGLGLANDSGQARPSIFNDDEEFGLLTRQDELLVRMLYDPRLRPGMTEREARPIAEAIAAELIGGES